MRCPNRITSGLLPHDSSAQVPSDRPRSAQHGTTNGTTTADSTLSGAVTPRSTDWGLALLVGLLSATGVMTLFAGEQDDASIFAVHGAGGFALGAVLSWKLRRVWRRLAEPARWDRRTGAGAAAPSLWLPRHCCRGWDGRAAPGFRWAATTC